MILQATPAKIEHCKRLLTDGQIIGVPTETVYGLAGNALNEASVRKIFSVKGRPLIDPLIVHCLNLEAVDALIEPNASLLRLAKVFWPGPLTIIALKKSTVPDIVTAGLPSVAIRVPGHPVLRSVMESVEFPLAAPSANPFGYVSPTLAEHVEQTLGDKIPAILDGGPCDIGLESTIVDLGDPSAPAILRQGPIDPVDISDSLGVHVATRTNSKSDSNPQSAPGQLTQHYSPNAKVRLFAQGTFLHQQAVFQPNTKSRVAFVYYCKPNVYAERTDIYWLSETGDLNEVGKNLFRLLQELDRQGFAEIWIERLPRQGLGLAINDRIERAAARSAF